MNHANIAERVVNYPTNAHINATTARRSAGKDALSIYGESSSAILREKCSIPSARQHYILAIMDIDAVDSHTQPIGALIFKEFAIWMEDASFYLRTEGSADNSFSLISDIVYEGLRENATKDDIRA